MNKRTVLIILTWLAFFLISLVMAFGLYKVFKSGDHQPLRTAKIPQSTIDWFSGLIDGGSDIGGIFNPDGWNPAEWGRYEDIDSMLRLEDEYFVIYYSSKDSAAERKKALVCQRYAHEAIPLGELFMKKYPYPDSLNGRKLPIYLANTVNDFRSICNQLGHGDPGTDAIGLYCFQYGTHGVYTDGIIISPRAWTDFDHWIDENTQDENLKRTLWHEMNHFMYLTNWDYTQTEEPFLWYVEGLAEYFSSNYDRLREVGNYNKLNLTEDFRGKGNTEYWAGMSAFLCLENIFSKSEVSDVVFNSYNHSVDESLRMAINNFNLSVWNTRWHTFMDNNEYKQYMH
jgi:hypothetical protein